MKMNGKPGGRRLTLSFRQGLTGVLFISPLLIGGNCLFLLPFFNTVTYMFGKVTVSSQGVDFAFYRAGKHPGGILPEAG